MLTSDYLADNQALSRSAGSARGQI